MTTPKAKTLFYYTLLITLAIKLYIAYIIPITGDEAEYTIWGEHLALGYYDHPPMIGWLMSLVTHFGTSNIWLRFPQTIISSIFALIMVKMLKPFDHTKAYLISAAYLVSPVSILDQGILTDTTLMWFTFLACVFLFFILKNNQTKNAKSHILLVLSGICWGLAYLSKFLVLPAALGVFIFFVCNRKIEKLFLKLGVIILAALPFFLFNIWWNYYHDWVNYAFNIGLRNQAMHLGFHHLWIYLVTIVYLYSPVVLYFLFKPSTWIPAFAGMTNKTKGENEHSTAITFSTVIIFTTLFFYLVLSLYKSIGLHWMFCTYPFAFIALITVLNVKQAYGLFKFMCVYVGIQIIAVMVIFHLPMHFFKQHLSADKYEKVYWFKYYNKAIPIIETYLKQGFILMTPSYSDSYLLTYKQKQTAAVWGVGTDNGRYDDFLSDFKTFNHKNVIVFDSQIRLRDKTFAPYFKHYQKRKVTLGGNHMLLWIGYDFNYPLYRKNVLHTIYKRFYTLPNWLPRGDHWYAGKYGFNNNAKLP